MRGGTVILATSPTPSDRGQLPGPARSVDSGSRTGSRHHGVNVERTLVLDERNAAFPCP
jgi:ABC-2 type transport system permease protein